MRQMREEHFKSTELMLPPSYWATRMARLVREVQGRAKDAHRRDAAVIADLNEESPELRAGRKTPKKM